MFRLFNSSAIPISWFRTISSLPSIEPATGRVTGRVTEFATGRLSPSDIAFFINVDYFTQEHFLDNFVGITIRNSTSELMHGHN